MRVARSLRDPWVWTQVGLLLAIGAGAPLLGRAVKAGWQDLTPAMPALHPWRRTGAAILLAGCTIAAWGAVSLGASLTPSVTPLEGSTMVESGAYAWVRHPIYLGVIVALTGYALLLTGLLPAAVAGATATFFFHAKARAEEQRLVWRYRGYSGYARRVPGLLPRIRRR